ncbi:NifU family protein [Malacoplasma penetrans]|uniref:Nitrogen fixation protein n=1 Tax=Malacoplasma penetrans (strain HF-2) TaxID=272633 RepID=Q8EWX4_MALP2|nr:NifU family protein [Malacoplasma penetrans]RXY97346.1 NifU family protein [Malacoplasma penetrans]BAC43866.1 nitrogen fixation protein [Malacoplasma penetrans HF-2]
MLDNNTNKIIDEIKDVIDSIRFYINQDGGDLEFVDYNPEKGEVTIKILGECIGCSLIDVTYKEGLETILKNEVEGVKSVIVTE